MKCHRTWINVVNYDQEFDHHCQDGSSSRSLAYLAPEGLDSNLWHFLTDYTFLAEHEECYRLAGVKINRFKLLSAMATTMILLNLSWCILFYPFLLWSALEQSFIMDEANDWIIISIIIIIRPHSFSVASLWWTIPLALWSRPPWLPCGGHPGKTTCASWPLLCPRQTSPAPHHSGTL